MFKPELYSNNKLTAMSLVSLSGILVKKLQTFQEIKKVLVALTFLIPSQNVNESFVEWNVGKKGSSKLVKNLER